MGHEAWAVIRLRESPTVTLVGGPLSHLEKLARHPAGGGRARGRAALRPAGRGAVPPGRRARVRRPRRRHPAGRGRHRRPSARSRWTSCSPRCPTRRSPSRTTGGFETCDEDYAARGRADHPRRDRQRRGRQPRRRPALPRAAARLGPRQGADRAAPAADQRARRLLDLLLLDRRPVPDRRLARAARQRARRRRADEPDLRHLPAARPRARPSARPGCWSSSPTRRRSSSSSWSSTRS